MKIIQDLWILKEGLVIFKRVFDEKIQDQLLGGFMSALTSFAQQIDKEGLSSFTIGDRTWYLKKQDGILFIANAGEKAKPKKIIGELDQIASKFRQKYPKELVGSWNGDVSFFNSFEDEIEDSIETPLEKLKDSFW